MGLIVYNYMGIWGGDGDKSSSTDARASGLGVLGGTHPFRDVASFCPWCCDTSSLPGRLTTNSPILFFT